MNRMRKNGLAQKVPRFAMNSQYMEMYTFRSPHIFLNPDSKHCLTFHYSQTCAVHADLCVCVVKAKNKCPFDAMKA